MPPPTNPWNSLEVAKLLVSGTQLLSILNSISANEVIYLLHTR